MSTQLFVVPVVQTTDQLGNTINVPEYFDTDLSGSTFACMPLTGASLSCSATAENDALAAESDVFAFPADLTPTMSDADIAALTAVLQNANVPTDFPRVSDYLRAGRANDCANRPSTSTERRSRNTYYAWFNVTRGREDWRAWRFLAECTVAIGRSRVLGFSHS